MPTKTLATDYLVIGAGASGLAFTDALIAASDAGVVIVDRRHAPGGHWNDACPLRSPAPAFVLLRRELAAARQRDDRHLRTTSAGSSRLARPAVARLQQLLTASWH